MRRCSGKAKDRDWGSAGRRVGSCSRGPASREGPHRVPGCRKCGELSAQHRHQPHRPLRAVPEPCGPRQAGAHRFLRHCLLDARAAAPRSGRSAAEDWGTNSPSLDRDRRSPRHRPWFSPRLQSCGLARLARSLLTLRFGDWAGSGGVGRRARVAAVLLLGRQRVGAWRRRGRQLGTPLLRHPSLRSWGRCSGHWLSTEDLPPTSPPFSAPPGAGCGALPYCNPSSNWEVGIQP